MSDYSYLTNVPIERPPDSPGGGADGGPSFQLMTRPPTKTLNQIILEVTDSYVSSLYPPYPLPEEIEVDLVSESAKACKAYNYTKPLNKVKVPTELFPAQIAAVMLKRYSIVRITAGDGADPDCDLLAIYQEEGPNEGIYVTDEGTFKQRIKELCYTITQTNLTATMELIRIDAPRRKRTTEKDLVPVNNGIFDFATKVLLDFDPMYIFLSKSRVNYNSSAKNEVIYNPLDNTYWDVESWMEELSDDYEIVDVLWEVLSAIVRPFVRWGKAAWFYSNTGNNGKGTLCELMRSLCGEGSYSSISLADMGKEFYLEQLPRANAIICDENNVGTFIDKAANLKAIITNDVITINRKKKSIISYQFRGFMVQCLNEPPRVKDKSDSFYRRQLFIPFEKCFTGKERKYIKDDYLHRPEVLEYVLYRVLHMNFYELSEPAACRDALEEYKEYNDPVRQFMDEMSPQFAWDLLPFSFLFALYQAWFKKNNPSGIIQGKHMFISDLLHILKDYPDWYCQGKSVSIRPGHRMDKKEYLIRDYDLRDWQNPVYTGQDPDKICDPKLKSSYYGLLRAPAVPTAIEEED
ncbi:MAG: DUF5906 domain-containing protein [Lachnospiraceae bacterium]|nr:DUF5906 domain-containing protein [Lachnospiraceae bacterium]